MSILPFILTIDKSHRAAVDELGETQLRCKKLEQEVSELKQTLSTVRAFHKNLRHAFRKAEDELALAQEQIKRLVAEQGDRDVEI